MFRITVQNIGFNPTYFQEKIKSDVIGQRDIDSLYFVDDLDVEVIAERVEKTVILKFKVMGIMDAICGKCLIHVSKDWMCQFEQTLEIGKNEVHIEVEDEIRQEVVMNLPDKIRCSSNCLGFCLQCGVNLNKEKCECFADCNVSQKEDTQKKDGESYFPFADLKIED